MGETTDRVKGDTPRSLAKAMTGEDPRAPWWAAWALKLIMVLGVPGAILGAREYRDYRYEGQRLDVERARITVEEKRNLIFERFEKVLWRVERKLPAENGGGDR